MLQDGWWIKRIGGERERWNFNMYPSFKFFAKLRGKHSQLRSSVRIIREVSATLPAIVTDQIVVKFRIWCKVNNFLAATFTFKL